MQKIDHFRSHRLMYWRQTLVSIFKKVVGYFLTHSVHVI